MRLWPFLGSVEVASFRAGVGVFLILYAGGVMGGIAGLSGPLPTLWCGLRRRPQLARSGDRHRGLPIREGSATERQVAEGR